MPPNNTSSDEKFVDIAGIADHEELGMLHYRLELAGATDFRLCGSPARSTARLLSVVLTRERLEEFVRKAGFTLVES